MKDSEGEMQAPEVGTGLPRVLIVEDSRAQRTMVAAGLRRNGYDVVEAASGADALDLADRDVFDIVLSDWMMPGMSGPDLCRALRSRQGTQYVYFIMLTAKSARDEIAAGLDSGADDFLTKPVSGDELRARLRAGHRIVEMQRQLQDKTEVIQSTLEEVRRLYAVVDDDLREARKLQQTLIGDRAEDFGAGHAAMTVRTAGHVGGDLVGFFPVGARHLALYSVDVSGHGVASALMTTRLAGHLNPAQPEHNIALGITEDGTELLPPAKVMARLNDLMFEVIDAEQYFTAAFAHVDLVTGRVAVSQAGHPHPLVQRVDGTIEFHGSGGLPIGLIRDAAYTQFQIDLAPGDRLLLCSDGMTECADADGGILDRDGLGWLLAARGDLRGQALLGALVADLEALSGDAPFVDDVSAVVFEFTGFGQSTLAP